MQKFACRTIMIQHPPGIIKDQHRITHHFYQLVPRHGRKVEDLLAKYPPCEQHGGDGECERDVEVGEW